MPGYTPLLRCAEVAATQYGVIAAAQAMTLGLSRDAIRRLASDGTWRRVRPSVFALWRPNGSRDIWLQRLSATGIWLGDAGAVSHRAAALIWDVDGVGSAPLEFWTTGRRRVDEAGLIIRRIRTLNGEDVVRRDAFRVTSMARTLVDLSAVITLPRLELAAESAFRRRLVSIEELWGALERTSSNQRGRGLLRRLLEKHPGRWTDSELEMLVSPLLSIPGFPAPIRQYKVWSDGRLVARVDFAYPAQKIAVEADGYSFHSSPGDWRRDRTKQNELVRLGWVVYRVTWDEAKRYRRRVREDIAALLARSGGSANTVTRNMRSAPVLGRGSRTRRGG